MSVGRSEVRRAASLIGGPGGLSLWAWVFYAPVNVLGPVLLGASGLGVRERLLAGAVGLLSLLVGVVVVLVARLLMIGRLRGSNLDAGLVILSWTLAASVSCLADYVFTSAAGLDPRWILLTPGFWVSKAATLLAITAAVVLREGLVAQGEVARSVVAAQRRHLLAARRRKDILVAAVRTAMGDSVDPGLESLARTLPDAHTPPPGWRAWGGLAGALARGPVRDLAHVVAAPPPSEEGSATAQRDVLRSRDSSDWDTEGGGEWGLPIVSRGWSGRVPGLSRLSVVIHEYPAVRPVTALPALLILPVQVQLIVSGRGSLVWALTTISLGILGLLAMDRITQAPGYRRLPTTGQWALVLGGQLALSIGIGLLSWWQELPLVAAQVVSESPSPQLAILIVSWTIIGVNLVGGTVALSLRNRRSLIASQNVSALLDALNARGLDRADHQLRRDLAATLHADLQGRLMALAIIAEGVADGRRDPEGSSSELAAELGRILRSLSDWGASADAHGSPMPILAPITEVVETWRPALDVALSTSLEPGLESVPAELAMAVGRVAAEGIANATTHAGATRCHVTLTADRTAVGLLQVTLVVQDNGTNGTDAVHTRPTPDGLGLAEVDRHTAGDWSLDVTSTGSTLTARLV